MSNQQQVVRLSGIIHNVHKKPTSTGRCMAVFTMGGKNCKCFGELAEYILQSEGEYAEIEATAGTYRGQTEYALVSVRATVQGRQVSIKDSRSVPKPQATGAKKPDVEGCSGQLLSDAEIDMIQEEISGLFQSFARRHLNDRELFEKIVTDTRMPGISIRAITDVLAHADANTAKSSSGTSNTAAEASASAAAQTLCPKISPAEIDAGTIAESSIAIGPSGSSDLQDVRQSPPIETHTEALFRACGDLSQDSSTPVTPALTSPPGLTADAELQARRDAWRANQEKRAAAKEELEYQKLLQRYRRGYDRAGYDHSLQFWIENIKTPLDQRALKQLIEERKASSQPQSHGTTESGSDLLTTEQRPGVQGVITKIVKLLITRDGRKMVVFNVGPHTCAVFGKVAEFLDRNRSDYEGKSIAVYGSWKINHRGRQEFVPAESTVATESDSEATVTPDEVQKALEKALIDGSGLSAVGGPTLDEMQAEYEAERERTRLVQMTESPVPVAGSSLAANA